MNRKEKIFVVISLAVFAVFAVILLVPFHAEKKKSNIRIAAVMPDKTDSFWKGVWNGTEQQADEMEVNLSKYRYSTGDNVDGIVQKLETAILSKTQGILLCANQYQSEEIRKLLKEARKSEIKIVLCDTDADADLRDAFIGVDNEKVGKECAKYIQKQKKIKKVILIKNRQEQISGATRQRALAFEESLNSQVSMESLILSGDENENFHLLKNTLEMAEEGTAVLCFNSSTTILAAQTIKRMRKESEVMFIGFSESEDALTYTKEGIIDRLYTQDNEELGRKSAEILKKLVEGKTVPEYLYINMISVEGGEK